MNIYEEIVNFQKKNVPFVVVTVAAKEGHGPQVMGAKMVVTSDSKSLGTIGGGALEFLAEKEARELLKKKSTPLMKKYMMSDDNVVVDAVKTGMICGGSIDLFYEPNGNLEMVYIFGAGHIGQALSYHLAKLDYKVILCDCRSEYKKENESASEVIIEDYSTILNDREVIPGSFMIVATHSHELDFSILKRIYKSNWDPKYIGVIASKKKSESILNKLGQEFKGNTIDLEKLYCPIGLKTGGATPHDIAISIIAEIQAIKFDKKNHNHFRNLSEEK